MSRPLHIVLVGYDAGVFHADAPGDTRRRHLAYAAEIARQRPRSVTSVVVLTPEPVSMERLPQLNLIPVGGRGLFLRWNLLRTLWKLHRERPVDVISPQTIFDDAWVCLLFALLTGARMVAQVHFDLFAPESIVENLGAGWNGRLRYVLGKRLLPVYYRIRVVGKGIQRQLGENGIKPERIITIPVPVTMPVMSDSSQECEPLVLFVGRLAPQKNLSAWLRIAQRIHRQQPEVSFVIAGDGDERAQLEALAQSLDVPVEFTGFVNYDDLPEHYARAAVLLLTSHYEGYGRVIVEAGLYQLPTVAPRITGIEDIIVDNETGFLHLPGDEAGMADSVLRLVNNPTLVRRMGEAAHERVRRLFDPEHLTGEIATLLISAARE